MTAFLGIPRRFSFVAYLCLFILFLQTYITQGMEKSRTEGLDESNFKPMSSEVLLQLAQEQSTGVWLRK